MQEKRREGEKRDEYREHCREGKKRDEDRERLGDRREDRSHLVGRWYKDNQPCEILSARDGFEARNERGDRSRGLCMIEMEVFVLLTGEGGLRGEIRGNRIVWANAISWRR